MVHIRSYDPSRPGDIHAITDIYGHHVRYGRASFETEPPTLTDMTARIDTLLGEDYPVLVAETGGTVRGYAYSGPP